MASSLECPTTKASKQYLTTANFIFEKHCNDRTHPKTNTNRLMRNNKYRKHKKSKIKRRTGNHET